MPLSTYSPKLSFSSVIKRNETSKEMNGGSNNIFADAADNASKKIQELLIPFKTKDSYYDIKRIHEKLKSFSTMAEELDNNYDFLLILTILEARQPDKSLVITNDDIEAFKIKRDKNTKKFNKINDKMKITMQQLFQ